MNDITPRHLFKCPDSDCHEKVNKTHDMATEHHETLYDDKTGVRAKIHQIELCLKDKISKTSVRIAIVASLTILLASFGTLASMWAQTKDVPDIKVLAQENRELARINEKNIAVADNQASEVDKDIDELKKGQDRLEDYMIELLKRIPER